MSTPRTPRQIRIQTIRAAIRELEAELARLEMAEMPARINKRRGERLPCGSEQSYQQHAHFGDTATADRRVTCRPCLNAHAEHERAKAAIRRATRRMEAAS